MFEVTGFDPPVILVKSRQTGETYRFEVDEDGTLTQGEAQYDRGDARRAAILYLARLKKVATSVATPAGP